MSPTSITAPSTTTTTVGECGASGISSLHPDVIETHILTRLDGANLASTSCASRTLRTLSYQDHLWFHICESTWPSTAAPIVRQVISAFPGGPRSFFSRCFPIPIHTFSSSPHLPSTLQLISSVDIHYQDELIFSKVQETETATDWFRCSPFRIDMLDPKDVVATVIEHPDGDETCSAIGEDMTLDWILIDPIGRRAVNLSSHKPVSVQRHWLTGEVQVRFASILTGDQKRSASGFVQCEVLVTCGGSEGGEMQVREVSLEVENIDGNHLSGKDSLVILERALEGKRGKGRKREEEGRRMYMEFLETKREAKERKLRMEGALDLLCVAFGVSIFAAFCFFMLRS